MSTLATLRALGEPRRLVPLGLVAGALLSAEWAATGSWASVGLDAALLLAFVLVAPALHRAWAVGEGSSWGTYLARWSAHVLVAAVIVGSIGVVLPPLLGVRWTYLSEPHSLGVLVALFVVGGWGLGRDIDLELGVTRERERAERLARDTEHAQLLALRAQLDPHFLFNTLNAIAEWCREDPRVAEAATLRLAEILRAIFDALESPRWSLGRELTLIEQLAELYAVRDRERYVFHFDVHPACREREVPALVLLPLFENAIKHGPAAGHAGRVTLSARIDGGDTLVELENPGPFRGRREGGRGVALVERRLALTYGDAASLSLEAVLSSTRTVVRLPAASEERGSP